MGIRHAQVQQEDNNQRNTLSFLLQVLEDPGSGLGCKILTTSAHIFWLKRIYFMPPIVSATRTVNSQYEAHAGTLHTFVTSFVAAFQCSVTMSVL